MSWRNICSRKKRWLQNILTPFSFASDLTFCPVDDKICPSLWLYITYATTLLYWAEIDYLFWQSRLRSDNQVPLRLVSFDCFFDFFTRTWMRKNVLLLICLFFFTSFIVFALFYPVPSESWELFSNLSSKNDSIFNDKMSLNWPSRTSTTKL